MEMTLTSVLNVSEVWELDAGTISSTVHFYEHFTNQEDEQRN